MYTKKDIEPVAQLMLKRKESLAVAESVSSGHLQAAISLSDDTTMFFQGGITAYNLGQKTRHLQIEPIYAEECNCVSSRVAEEMAINVTKLFSSNWGIALTGYAWPVPEFKVEEPFAFYAIAYAGRVVASGRIDSETKAGRASQEYFVKMLLKKFAQTAKQVRRSKF